MKSIIKVFYIPYIQLVNYPYKTFKEKKTTNDLNSHPTFVTMEFREVSIWDSNLYIGIFPVFYVYFRMLHAFSQVPDVTIFIIKIYLLYLIIHIRLFQLLNH